MKETLVQQGIPPVFIVNIIAYIRKILLKISSKLSHPTMEIMELTQAFWLSKAIGVASSLGIADLLEKAPCSVHELAEKTNTHPDFLYRLLRMLASRGVFKEKEGSIFSNTRLSRTFLDKPHTMKYMIEHQISLNSWNIVGAMEHSVKNGLSVSNLVLGETVYDYLSKNPAQNTLYNKAMSNASLLISSVVLKAYSFASIKKMVDIGGGHGVLLSEIVAYNHHLQGVVFDLPHVISDIPRVYLEKRLDRISFQPGNVFESVPNADGYLLKSVLHSFNDNDCVKILKNICKAADPGAKILIVEPLIGKKNEPSFGKLFDVLLMLGTEGGCERTKKEYEDLFKQSDLRIKRFIPTISPFTIIEAVKEV